MENKEIKSLLFLTIKRLQRKRTLLCQELHNVHRRMLENSANKKSKFKDILALQCSLPEIFFQINVPRHRSIHRQVRRDNFMCFMEQTENEHFYYEYFRMSKESFSLLCEKLSPFLPCPTVFVTAPLSISKQVALCLYKLASCSEYRVVGDVFGVHKSTVHKYFHRVINAILRLRKEFLYFPKLEKAKEIASGFQKITNLPNIIGAIDATHIPILPPTNGYQEYINQKRWPSIVMQAVVDDKYLFRDVSVKFPGGTHASTVLKECGLYKYSMQMIPTHFSDVNGLPLMLIGNPAYPLLPWLIKPYTGCVDPEEESFNCYINSGRIVVENAFGRLKGRWRCLSKRMDIDPSFVPFVVLACSILHNFVETKKERFFKSWLLDVQNEVEFSQPNDTVSNEITQEGNINRENLKTFLKDNFPLRNSSL